MEQTHKTNNRVRFTSCNWIGAGMFMLALIGMVSYGVWTVSNSVNQAVAEMKRLNAEVKAMNKTISRVEKRLDRTTQRIESRLDRMEKAATP